MALKRKIKRNANFSMASMTDIIFLLLIFFMVTSSIIVPNAIKVTLPQSQKQTAVKSLVRVTIDKGLNFYVSDGKQIVNRQVQFEEIGKFLEECKALDPEMYMSIWADEEIPYSEVVKVINIANTYGINMVLALRPITKTK